MHGTPVRNLAVCSAPKKLTIVIATIMPKIAKPPSGQTAPHKCRGKNFCAQCGSRLEDNCFACGLKLGTKAIGAAGSTGHCQACLQQTAEPSYPIVSNGIVLCGLCRFPIINGLCPEGHWFTEAPTSKPAPIAVPAKKPGGRPCGCEPGIYCDACEHIHFAGTSEPH